MKHEEIKRILLSRPGVKAEYDRLGPEFELLSEMLRARQKAGLTQTQVAERMGTQSTAVTRLEGSLSSGKHSPSIETVKRYAHAVGCELRMKFVPQRQHRGH
jgi:transcriptional regulator with XRE-family HTH domain